VFVPSPAQAGQQTVDVITRVTHAELAPDQAGDSFRGEPRALASANREASPVSHEAIWGGLPSSAAVAIRRYLACGATMPTAGRTVHSLLTSGRLRKSIHRLAAERWRQIGAPPTFWGRVFHILRAAASHSRTKMGVSGRTKTPARTARIPLRSGNQSPR
jgi:hypothetical protein